MGIDYSAETEFIIRCFRGEKPEPVGIDSNKLMHLLKFHHISENIASVIERCRFKDEELDQKLKVEKSLSAVHRMALRNGFKSLTSILQYNKIDFVVFKGIYLADIIYPANQQRQYADHDILVHDSDLKLTEDILIASGYYLQESLHNKFSVEMCAMNGFPRALANRKAQYLQCDLHTKISVSPGPKFFDPSDCWDNAVLKDISGIQIKVLPPEIALLHLCWHTIKHSFCRLLWIQDIYYFLRKHDILTGDSFLGMVEKYHCQQIVVTALGLVEQVFGDSAYTVKLKSAGIHISGHRGEYFRIPGIFYPRRDLSAKDRVCRDLSLIPEFSRKVYYLCEAAFPHPNTLPGLSGQVSGRLSIRYFMDRVKIFFRSMFDFIKSK